MNLKKKQEMKRIATHNSVTGEKGKGLLSFLVAPFSKCQSKTLEEQYDAGCRFFDIRTWLRPDGIWVCGHGMWTAKITLSEVLDFFLKHEDAYFSITIEKGELDEYANQLLYDFGFIDKCHLRYQLAYIAVKKPQWRIVKSFYDMNIAEGYKNLDGRSWHTYLPIPWLWKKIYYNKPVFLNGIYVMVDFL